VRTLWAYAGSYCVVFAQGNPLGKKPAPLSRLNCAMPAQESVVPSKRRLSLILMSIVLVTVVLRGCVEPFEVCRTVAASQRWRLLLPCNCSVSSAVASMLDPSFRWKSPLPSGGRRLTRWVTNPPAQSYSASLSEPAIECRGACE